MWIISFPLLSIWTEEHFSDNQRHAEEVIHKTDSTTDDDRMDRIMREIGLQHIPRK